MPDIEITTRHYKGTFRAVVIPLTEKGVEWIIANMTTNKSLILGDPAIVINEEFAKELAEDLIKEGLEVELK